ncbi:BamA/TamA family outer membrane protein [Alphaproteobacteria bacterium KMM 3653]|uniref:BamA/TamA family outer membrane protein n=1 Tax=Harenicola maris TaxID=2841044 RepID=A0AAP2CQH0_9RHOB|nr:BamA/TamA family outer membrane protein [Harenicola maris]
MKQHIALLACLSLMPASAIAFEYRIDGNGLDSDLLGELRAVSLAAPMAADDSLATAQDVVAAAQADYARLVGLFYDRGYFAPVVSIRVNGREASEISPFAAPAQIDGVVVSVESGPVFTFGTARIAPLAPETEVPPGFASGVTATTGAMRDAATAGVEGWRNQGHALAALDGQQITARHGADVIDAELRIAPGERLRFGDLVVEGENRMRVERIRAIAGLPANEVFDPEELDRVAARLRRSGAFDVVSIEEAEAAEADGTLDITARIVESKRRRLGFGAELSTQTGLTLSTYWLHRNLLGGGERLRIEGEISELGSEESEEEYSLTVSFGRPATFYTDLDFYATAELSRERVSDLTIDVFDLESGFTYYATDKREYSLGLSYEAANVTDETDGSESSYQLFGIPATALFDYRNNTLNPTDGYYGELEIMPFIGLSGVDNGVLSTLDARAYKSFGANERVTLAARAQVGSLAGPDLTSAPANYLFYSGGGGTVRGQEFESLGVELDNGDTVGGRSFLGLSTEVRVKTGKSLSVVGFYDLGYVGSESFPDGESGDWHAGVGLGVRYDTGVGPIRFDVAVPVDREDDQDAYQIYIGIGQAF